MFLGVLSVIGTVINFVIAIANLIVMVLSFLFARYFKIYSNTGQFYDFIYNLYIVWY